MISLNNPQAGELGNRKRPVPLQPSAELGLPADNRSFHRQDSWIGNNQVGYITPYVSPATIQSPQTKPKDVHLCHLHCDAEKALTEKDKAADIHSKESCFRKRQAGFVVVPVHIPHTNSRESVLGGHDVDSSESSSFQTSSQHVRGRI